VRWRRRSDKIGAAMRPSTALFALLFGVYAYFYQAGGWNQNSRFDLVRAIAEHGTLSIDRYEANTGDDSIVAGHYYCDKAPGASFLCLPTYALMYTLAGRPDPVPPGFLAWAVWLSIVLAVAAPSALAAVFLVRLCVRLGFSRRAAVATALLWGLGTMALPYSTLLYGNQLSASLMVIAFTLLVEVRQGSPPAAGRLILVGALLGYAVATEYPAALIGIPIALYGLYVVGLRRVGFAATGGLAVVAALLTYHWAAFGSPLAFPYDYSVWPTPRTGWFMGIRQPSGEALKNILVGQYRGLLFATPWLAAAVPGSVLLIRRRTAEAIVCICAVIGFLWLNASIPPWDGGWAAGPRYLVPMLPFLSVLAGAVFFMARVRLEACVVVGVLGVFSIANMFAATAVKPEIPTSETRPYTGMIWPKFIAGELAVSTQSIDAIGNPPNAPRQAWNLGMKAGLDGHLSLLPLALWIAGTLAWLSVALSRETAER